MQTEVVPIDPHHPEPDKIQRAAELLRRGELVAFATETVYGLGANALDRAAVQKVFDAKDRPATNPLIVHVADVAATKALCLDWPSSAEKLASRFWPGPLTLVVKKRPEVPDIVTAGGPTVALRVPGHPVALALLRTTGLPLAAPSANRSARLSPTRAQHVLRDLAGRIAMILDAGPTTGGIESTVVDVTPSLPRVLRPGIVTATELQEAVGPISHDRKTEVGPVRSPGVERRHYAPRTALECCDDVRSRAQELRGKGVRVACVVLARSSDKTDSEVLSTEYSVLSTEPLRVLPNDPRQFAAELYAVLHELDETDVDRIVVEMPPDTDDWRAIRDRLARAAMT